MHPPVDPKEPLSGLDTPTRGLPQGAYTGIAVVVILSGFIAAIVVRHVFFSPDWRLNREKQARSTQVRRCPTPLGLSCPHPPATQGGMTATASFGLALRRGTP